MKDFDTIRGPSPASRGAPKEIAFEVFDKAS